MKLLNNMIGKNYYGVSVRKYQKMNKEYDGTSLMMDRCIPVDLNGAFVPLDKSKENDNLDKASWCIKARFGLE